MSVTTTTSVKPEEPAGSQTDRQAEPTTKRLRSLFLSRLFFQLARQHQKFLCLFRKWPLLRSCNIALIMIIYVRYLEMFDLSDPFLIVFMLLHIVILANSWSSPMWWRAYIQPGGYSFMAKVQSEISFYKSVHTHYLSKCEDAWRNQQFIFVFSFHNIFTKYILYFYFRAAVRAESGTTWRAWMAGASC